MARKARKTNYANEVELKSLLIRAKNKALGLGDGTWNRRINELVGTYIKTDTWRLTARVQRFRKAVKNHIVWACEKTCAGDSELNRLSAIVDLMVDRILTKPQFSGYTYVDEFHSDVQFKIFRYITNFDHRKISKISGDYVNAFAYVTQIIHNSIIYVISTNKKNQERIKAEYHKQQIAFAADNPGIKPVLMADPERKVEPGLLTVTKYYYNKNDFLDHFEQDLELIDFSKVSEMTVWVPHGCDVSNFTDYNVIFKELPNCHDAKDRLQIHQ